MSNLGDKLNGSAQNGTRTNPQKENGSQSLVKEDEQSSDAYSVPKETQKLFQTGILENPLIKKSLPAEAKDFAPHISFTGSDEPSIPVNWRFAESVSALLAYEATILNVLLHRKYGVEPVKVEINTDHAQLFIMSTLLWTLDPAGDNLNFASTSMSPGRDKWEKMFPNWDLHRSATTPHRAAATNIYNCKDGRYFHVHGSMNPDPTLRSLGLPLDMPAKSEDEAWLPFEEAVSKLTSEELQHIASDEYKQAGTICWTTEEYRNSEHGKANAHVGLFEIHAKPNPVQEPCWWPDTPQTSPKRPLAGLKVVDLTRVIAAPTVGRTLAELGASIMRVTAPHICDYSALHLDLNHGKWNSCLDLRKEDDRQKLRDLIIDADVVIQGYRPGVLDKYGFSQEDIVEMCKDRKRGIIYARENCYGWNGPWAYRSGWQQISDANCGVSMEFGRAMGNDEPVTPVFPNSDYCTGIAGAIAIMTALLRRAQEGGSYTIDVALNYYSQWLVNSVGVYPPATWHSLWSRNGNPVLRHHHNMGHTIPRLLQLLKQNSGSKLFRPDHFTEYEIKHLGGKKVRIVAPVLRFPGGEVQPGYQVGTRTNGVDKPVWPEDLMVEVVE